MVGIENISAPSKFPDKDAFKVLGWAVLEEGIVFAGDRRRCLGHRIVSMGWAVFGFGRLLARRGQRHGTAVRDGAPRVFIHLWGDERERQERSEVRFGHDMGREADVGDAFPVIRIWRRRPVTVFCCLRKISTRRVWPCSVWQSLMTRRDCLSSVSSSPSSSSSSSGTSGIASPSPCSLPFPFAWPLLSPSGMENVVCRLGVAFASAFFFAGPKTPKSMPASARPVRTARPGVD